MKHNLLWTSFIAMAAVAILALAHAVSAAEPGKNPQGSATGTPAASSPNPQPGASTTPAENRSEGRAALGVFVAPSETGRGIRVLDVDPAGPAGKAGIVPGDLITSIDKKEVNTPRDLMDQIRTKQPGHKTEIAFVRGQETKSATATLVDRTVMMQGRGPGMPGMPGEFPERPSQDEQRLETLLQQVLNEVQQLRREVQELRGKQGTSTTMQNTAPQTERK